MVSPESRDPAQENASGENPPAVKFHELSLEEEKKRYEEMKKREAEEAENALSSPVDQPKSGEGTETGEVGTETKKGKKSRKKKSEAEPQPEPEKPPVEPEPVAEPAEKPVYKYISPATLELLGGVFEKDESVRGTLTALDKRRKEIESQLLTETNEDKKKELFKEKAKLSSAILEVASEISGDDEKQELKREEGRQFGIAVSQSKYKTVENFEAEMRKKYYNDVYNELIDQSKLSAEQKKVLKEEGEVIVSNWPTTVILSKAEVAVATQMGIDVSHIKRKGFMWYPGMSKKIVVEGGPQSFKDSDDFLNQIAASKERRQIDEQVWQKVEAKKREIIEKAATKTGKPLTDEITDQTIDKIMAITREQSAAPEVKEQKKEQPVEAKKELSVQEKLGRLSELRNKWKKIEKIDLAIKEKRRIKTEDGRVLWPGKEEKNKEELDKIRQQLSDEIIDIANKISGRKLREEARGVWDPIEIKKPGYKGLDTEFRRAYLTNEIDDIYIKAVKDIESLTGKKVIAKQKSLSKTNYRQLRGGIKKGVQLKPVIERDLENFESEEK